MGVNIKTLMYQVPGGMLSNLVSQLKEAGAEDKYYQVLEEVPRVRKDFGEPPLVTPSSQIVGTQAVLNVLQGERYKMMTKESKKILRGEFGQTVKPFNKEVQKKAIGDAEADHLPSGRSDQATVRQLPQGGSSVYPAGRGCTDLCTVPAGCY